MKYYQANKDIKIVYNYIQFGRLGNLKILFLYLFPGFWNDLEQTCSTHTCSACRFNPARVSWSFPVGDSTSFTHKSEQSLWFLTAVLCPWSSQGVRTTGHKTNPMLPGHSASIGMLGPLPEANLTSLHSLGTKTPLSLTPLGLPTSQLYCLPLDGL